jgi:hypothetical protein
MLWTQSSTRPAARRALGGALPGLLGLLALAACHHVTARQANLDAAAAADRAAQLKAADETELPGTSGSQPIDQRVKSITVALSSGTVEIVPRQGGAAQEFSWEIVHARQGRPADPATGRLILHQSRDGELKLRDDYVGPARQTRPAVHLTLTVPPELALNVQVDNGSVKAQDCAGRINLHVGTGSVDVTGKPIESSVLVDNGDIRGDLTLTQGNHTLTASQGKLDLMLAKGSSVEYEASISKGKIYLGGVVAIQEKDTQGERLTGQIGGGVAQLDLHAGRGSIYLSGTADLRPVTGDDSVQ